MWFDELLGNGRYSNAASSPCHLIEGFVLDPCAVMLIVA